MQKSGRAALGLVAVWGLVGSVSAQTVDKALLEKDLTSIVETVSEVVRRLLRWEALADGNVPLLVTAARVQTGCNPVFA